MDRGRGRGGMDRGRGRGGMDRGRGGNKFGGGGGQLNISTGKKTTFEDNSD